MASIPSKRLSAWGLRIIPWLVGAAVTGLIAGDQWTPLKPLYFFPAALIAPAAWITAWLQSRKGFSTQGLLTAAGGAILTAKVLFSDFPDSAPPTLPPSPEAFRLVHWNVMRGALGKDGFQGEVLQDAPDLIVFSEPPEDFDLAAAGRLLMPDGVVEDAHMPILSRFPIEEARGIRIRKGAAWCIRINTPGGLIRFVGLDIESSPLADRSIPIQGVWNWMKENWDGPPFVLFGDFNIPPDSVHLEPIRRRFDLAHRLAGAGWPYTWPTPLPLWAIDQTWVDPRVSVVNCEFRSSVYSDHRRQVVDLTLHAGGSEISASEELE